MPSYDLIVAGGGPAGSAAGWRAAGKGARVLLVDKAKFPRDKPCGDGLTPRAVGSLRGIGLSKQLESFHRVNKLRVFGANRSLEFPWPESERFPDHGYVVARTELDEIMLRHAQNAGCEVMEETSVTGPLYDGSRVCGVVTKHGELKAQAVIAADGASSVLGRATGMVRLSNRPMGVAIRAHFEATRPPDDAIESYLDIRDNGTALPAYGWVFPMSPTRINVGVGLLSTYKRWRDVNTASLMEVFLRGLPDSWGLPGIGDLRSDGSLKGWRLPMAFAVWPPWRPGVVVVGDAAGVINPFNGEGISEAIDSGVAGVDVILDALGSQGPDDLSAYPQALEQFWGPYYRLGRVFARLVGHPRAMSAIVGLGMRVPPVMSFAFKVLANLYREQGGTKGDATMRGLLKIASVIRAG